MVAIGNLRSHHAFLFSGPELGFSAPEELYEQELHGPGLDVRGITAPGAPVIAIGHNAHVAFGLTSGLSQTNALYVEHLVPGNPDAYYYRGQIRQMDCREETFKYNPPPTSLLPPGVLKSPPQSGSVTLRLCRTIHGPVQARVGNIAYARRYATWGREFDTLSALANVDAARSVADVNRSMASATWNENMAAADDRGHIGYWHPGLLPIRPKGWDERLPYPGDGRAEWSGFLPVARRPHVIDPAQGWLSNWNNIPSQGWTTGNDPASERVAGPWFRVAWLNRQVARVLRRPSFAAMNEMIHQAGSVAEQRPLAAARLRRALRGARDGAAVVLRTILRWNGSYNETDSSGTVDPGVAAWQTFKDQLQAVALAPLGPAGQLIGGGEPNDEHDVRRRHRPGLRDAHTRPCRLAPGRGSHVRDAEPAVRLERPSQLARAPRDLQPERAGSRAASHDAVLRPRHVRAGRRARSVEVLAVFAEQINPDDPLSGLRIEDRPDPEVPAGWTTVSVKAASLNHHDLWSLRGVGLPEERLPMILGCDAAGLDEDGNEVVVHSVISDPDWRGDETLDPRRSLLSERYQGTLAEKVAVPRDATSCPKPAELSFEEAACLPTAWLTAYRMLFTRGGVVPGMTVLVQGAGGGVATAAIVLASAMGARVWVTARSEEKRQQALGLGAAGAFESGARLPERVDVVMETVGEATWAHSVRALKPGGTLVVSGATTGQAPPAELGRVFFLQLSVIGSTMGTRDELERLIRLCVEKGLRPAIDRTLPLAQAREGFAAMLDGSFVGKIVFSV